MLEKINNRNKSFVREKEIIEEQYTELRRYPLETESAITVDKLFYCYEKPKESELMSSRIVKSVSHLSEGGFIGWQLYAPKDSVSSIEIFGSTDITNDDLGWMAKAQGKYSCGKNYCFSQEDNNLDNPKGYLYELRFRSEIENRNNAIGFSANKDIEKEYSAVHWPIRYSNQFVELIGVLRQEGAIIRTVFGKATDEEISECRNEFLRLHCMSKSDSIEYLGNPVRVKNLIWLAGKSSVRLRTIINEIVSGMNLKYLGEMKEKKCMQTWMSPLTEATVMPEMAARINVFDPVINSRDAIGIEVCDAPVKPLPAQEIDTAQRRRICVGKTTDTAGIDKDVFIGDLDLRCHYEIIGSSGTGKSTLLSKTIVDAIKKGYGLTLFDPHGSTIDVVLRLLPERFANKVRVVRLGDADNPVPLSMWAGNSVEENERNISDLTLIFEEIFDPHHQGLCGPRWERWFSTFAKVSLAIFGNRSSFESIIAISSSQDVILEAAKVIEKTHPELYRTIRDEYGLMGKNEFSEFIGWSVSKFQRIISIPELRKTIGAGINALDFSKYIDSDIVTLIDLATPKLGIRASRIMGCILLMQLWNAVLCRKEREKTHIVAIDEAHLFQNNPLPRMLAEGRKFGIGIVLVHQHCGQLSESVREALEANSANFSAFRLSSKDANIAAIRFDDSSLINSLCHLDSFNAVTTIGVDGRQSKPFTLRVEKPIYDELIAENIAKAVEEKSIEEMVNSHRKYHALTQDGFILALRKMKNEESIIKEQRAV